MKVLLQNYQEILNNIQLIRNFKEDYITNIFPNEEKFRLWIDLGILFRIDSVDGAFIFYKQDRGFRNYYFCARSLNVLKEALRRLSNAIQTDKAVIDFVGSQKQIEPLGEVLKVNGFEYYKSIVRMSRSVSIFEDSNDNNIIFADKGDLDELYNDLYEHFDPFSEQLPIKLEIEKWIENKEILVYRYHNKIIGFVIFQMYGVKSFLRYWFVHPDHRDKKVGSKLLRKFFKLCEKSKRQIFWVIADNQNAIKRYEKYGFKKESIYNYVYIK